MSVKVEMQEKGLAKMTIEVAYEEFDKAIQNVYMKTRKDINIPGFRKGKAPRMLIEKMYGEKVFYEDAAQELVQAEYPKAAQESELSIESRPQIELVQAEKGQPFIFTAVVAIPPEVELGQYKGVEIPIMDRTVTDEDVENELKKEQEKNSRMVTIEDRPVENEDIVTLDYAGTVDGVAFDGGSAEDYALTIGSGTFIPGFEEQLIGSNTGEEKDITVTFPENYHAADLKGKEAVFHCTIKKIEKKELPELDDDFAMDVSEFDTLAEYKEDVKKMLQERKENAAKSTRADAALAKAVENAKIELPQLMIDSNAEDLFESYAGRMQQQGLDIRQYAQMTGMTYVDMINNMKPQAEHQLKTRFVLEKVAEAEGLEVTDEYMNKKIEESAKMYNMDVEDLKKIFDGPNAEGYKKQLLTEMAAEFLGENAQETEAATKAAEEAANKMAEESAKIIAENKAKAEAEAAEAEAAEE